MQILYSVFRLAQLVDNKDIELYGCLHEADLVLSRYGIISEWENEEEMAAYMEMIICNNHLDRLIHKWDNKKYHHIIPSRRSAFEGRPVCSAPQNIMPHFGPAPLVNRKFSYLQKSEAFAVLVTEGALFHIGIRKLSSRKFFPTMKIKFLALCPTHQAAILVLKQQLEPPPPPPPSPDHSQDVEITSETRKYFKKFALSTKEYRALSYKDAEEMSPETLRKKETVALHLIKIMCELMAPGKAKEFQYKVACRLTEMDESQSPKDGMHFIMCEIAKYAFELLPTFSFLLYLFHLGIFIQIFRAFIDEEDRLSKKYILSLIATSMPFKKIAIYLPNITRHQYLEARKYPLIKFKEEEGEEIQVRMRVPYSNVNLFIGFLTE